jgi:hypothetical protein
MTSAPLAPSLTVFLLLVLAAPLGCGGGVVVEPTGSGAGGTGSASATHTGTTASLGATSSTGAAGSTGSGSNPSCVELGKAYEGALAKASQCNACIDFDGCQQGMIFTDICGCPVGTDLSKPDEAQEAKAAQLAWINAGCSILPCSKPCPIGNDWHCQASPGGGCNGTCTSL